MRHLFTITLACAVVAYGALHTDWSTAPAAFRSGLPSGIGIVFFATPRREEQGTGDGDGVAATLDPSHVTAPPDAGAASTECEEHVAARVLP